MTEGNTTPKPPAPTAFRLDAEAVAALDALAATAGERFSRHRLAVTALTYGARALAADPSTLLRLLVGVDLAARAAEQRPAAAPVAVVATGVAASSTPDDGAAPPQPPPAAPPAAPALVVAAAPAEAPAAPLDASDDPNRYATAAELARLRRALVAATKRGASILAIATAAGVNTGGSRKALARVKGGESPRVTLRVVAAATSAAEAWGA